MRFGKRHPDAEAPVPSAEPAPAADAPADERVPPSWTQDDDEPTVEAAVVDADAVELPAEESPAVEPAAVESAAEPADIGPPAEPADVGPPAEPADVEVAVEPAYVEPVAEPAAVAPAVEPATFRPAAVAVAPPSDHNAFAHGAPPPVPLSSWQEPLRELADQRPEYAVGAAFAGGILAAMILRRLGS